MKKLLIILMCLLLVPIVIAQDPDVIVYEEPQLNWFQKLLKPLQFSALGGTFSESSVTKGDYVNSIVDLKFYHDAEKYKLTFWFMEDTGKTSEKQIGNIAMTRIVNIPHKTGDLARANIKNIPTSSIPDSYCGKKIKGYVAHYSYWGGYIYGDNLCHLSEPVMSSDCISNTRLSYDTNPTWHREEGSYLDDTFTLKCGQECEEKYIGSNTCIRGNVKREKQLADCSTSFVTISYCHNDGCSDGQCLEPCETGNIGSEFCKDNSVYQKVGLGMQGEECAFEDELIESCSDNQLCDGANCIDQETCGDGTCSNDETYNSCPEDCEKPWRCGDETCNEDEDEENCPVDCQFGCSEGEEQKETCEDETIIVSHICNENNEWIETGKKCSGEIPSWVIPTVIGVLFFGSLIIILASGKKKKGKKRKK